MPGSNVMSRGGSITVLIKEEGCAIAVLCCLCVCAGLQQHLALDEATQRVGFPDPPLAGMFFAESRRHTAHKLPAHALAGERRAG